MPLVRPPPPFIRIAARLGALPRPARLALYAAAVGVLLVLCLAPTRDLPGSGLIWDKWEHVVAWFVLTVAGYLLAPERPRAVTVFAVLLGVAVELTQAAMGFGRQGDWRDLVADSIGVGLAVGASLAVRARRRNVGARRAAT